MSTEKIHTPPSGKSIQQYIDETPVWSDGTSLKGTPMTAMQWRIWSLAVAGKFFEGLVIFMTGIALPLIVRDFTLQAAQKGVVTAVALFGILIGATMLGGLSDIFGRKRMFIAEMVIFVVFLIGLTLSPSYLWMVICLFGIGLALGCDYPTAHLVISEAVPSKGRGGLVLGAFAFQAVGAIVGAGLGIIILDVYPEVDAWRWMYAAAVIPAILVIVGRFFITDSPPLAGQQGAYGRSGKGNPPPAQAGSPIPQGSGPQQRTRPSPPESQSCCAFQQQKPARHFPRRHPLVHSGFRYLRYRYFYPDHSGHHPGCFQGCT